MSFEDVDIKLCQIMQNIFKTAYDTSVEFDCEGDLVKGANIADFIKVANSMINQAFILVYY